MKGEKRSLSHAGCDTKSKLTFIHIANQSVHSDEQPCLFTHPFVMKSLDFKHCPGMFST